VSGRSRRVVVGVTGASGAIYAVRLLERLRRAGREIHLVASGAGLLNVHHELGLDRKGLESLADVAYKSADIGAAIASGSFAAEATVIVPCSMKSLAAIAHGLSDNLLTRAADVALKERRKLVLMVRETPLNLAHLRNMTSVTSAVETTLVRVSSSTARVIFPVLNAQKNTCPCQSGNASPS
jgi:4-hydroxy-3-polyprenylbenzoate decarboxylase